MTLLWVSGCPFILVPCGGFCFGTSLWVLGAGLGRLDYFSLGKNNSLRSDIFFLAGKIIQPPRPSQYRGIGGEDNCKRWKRKLNQKPENDQKQTGTPSKRSTGRGVVREFFLRKRCLSEASCFSQKKFSGHPATKLPTQRRNKSGPNIRRRINPTFPKFRGRLPGPLAKRPTEVGQVGIAQFIGDLADGLGGIA